MEYNQFKQLLQLKGIREKETVSLLEDFIEKFPYCQTSRLLFAKALHDQNNIHYDKALKLAAAYAPNREVLRNLIEMKTEEVEFVFPLGEKAVPEPVNTSAQPPLSFGAADTRTEEPYEEWYSEDEISGRAFAEQRENEKVIDPHEVIRQRLSEILAAPPPAPPQKEEEPAAQVREKNAGNIEALEKSRKSKISGQPAENSQLPKQHTFQSPVQQEKEGTPAEKSEEKLSASVEVKSETAASVKSDPNEKSREEKDIIVQAGKAIDVLDRMELEHAMEESILDSLAKLPSLIPPGSDVIKGKGIAVPRTGSVKAGAVESPSFGGSRSPSGGEASTPRSFTEWLKTIDGLASAGFEEVRAPKIKADIPQDTFHPAHEDEPETQLSDDELIEKFLLEDPKIVPSKAEFYSPVSQAKKSVMDHDDVVSETLAQIYLQQGNMAKARWCYEKLILLHPEKSAFFAALLKEIPEGGD